MPGRQMSLASVHHPSGPLQASACWQSVTQVTPVSPVSPVVRSFSGAAPNDGVQSKRLSLAPPVEDRLHIQDRRGIKSLEARHAEPGRRRDLENLNAMNADGVRPIL